MLTKVDKAKKSRISEVFVMNVRQALKVVPMPHSEKEICNFWGGSVSQSCSGDESEVERSDGDGGSEEDDEPPKQKRRKKAVKMLKVMSLKVS